MVLVGLFGTLSGGTMALQVAQPALGQGAVARTPPTQIVGDRLGTPGRALVATGVRRMLPSLLREQSGRRAGSLWNDALKGALKEASTGVTAHYLAHPDRIFTLELGLSEAGRVIVEGLLDPAGLADLGHSNRGRLVAEAMAILAGERVAGEVPLVLDDDLLVDAWRLGGGNSEGVLTALADVGGLSNAVASLTEGRLASEAKRWRAQAKLEVLLAEAAVELLVARAHVPRRSSVLADADGVYLSPDVLWVDQPASVTEEEVAGLMAAASRAPEEIEAHLAAREPTHREYRLLTKATRRYAGICERGGWQRLKVPWATRARRWKNKTGIRALQRRLRVEGFLEPAPTGEYGDETVEAVRRFQRAHHLKSTGSFNAETAAALNVSCDERLRTLQLNLRRWRRTARQEEETYVNVNLPAMEVRLFADGEQRSRYRAVVGSGRSFWSSQSQRRIYPRASPLITDHIDRVVVNPSWTVPPRIYRLEYKPRIERDPNYLEQNGFRLTQGDYGHPILVQPPGPDNSLGQVKVLFPNSEGIYIHDTNQRDLFRYARRAFSHGCVRVDKALSFATDLMKVDRERVNKRWHKRTLERFAEDDETRTYVLHERIPVFLEYYTASVSKGGAVYFHPDIYAYDRRTFTALLGKRGTDTAQR